MTNPSGKSSLWKYSLGGKVYCCSLLGVVAVEGKVDVGSQCLRVVHTQHPLIHQSGLVLMTEGIQRIPQQLTHLGSLSEREQVSLDGCWREGSHLKQLAT